MHEQFSGVTVALINQLRQDFGFAPSKALGQNFLIDSNIASKIASYIDSNVLEVGPGLGSLTIHLSRKADKVFAVELDKYLIEPLQKVLRDFNLENVEVLNQDIMNLEIEEFCKENDIKAIAGNLPYNISAVLLVDIAMKASNVNTVVAMVQKEVAQRLCAEQKSRNVSSATLKLQYFMDAKLLFDVPPKSFYPPPNVDSSVILLTRKVDVISGIKQSDLDEWFELIDTAFSQRRKMLRKSLSSIFGDDAEKIFETANVSATLRPEHCDLEDFAKLYQAFKDIRK